MAEWKGDWQWVCECGDVRFSIQAPDSEWHVWLRPCPHGCPPIGERRCRSCYGFGGLTENQAIKKSQEVWAARGGLHHTKLVTTDG